jgi:hypothetical protein
MQIYREEYTFVYHIRLNHSNNSLISANQTVKLRYTCETPSAIAVELCEVWEILIQFTYK